MSNYLAIATVTAALYKVLLNAVQEAVPGAQVGFSRPTAGSDDSDGPMVNIYLYQVTPNAAYRNVDLPTRNSGGTMVHKPLAALDLHYLITFQGNDATLDAQLMLGAVVSTLQDQPLLSPASIEWAIGAYGFLATSTLGSQVERVRFTPTALTLDEFSKLWSAFFQVEYSLSVAYQASVVLIESAETPSEALPVQSRNVYVTQFSQPTITQVIAQTGANQPILPSSTLVIQGTNLLGDLTAVRIGALIVTPPVVTNNAIKLPVPAGLQAGVLGVQVIQQMQLGTPPMPHPGPESNIAGIVLHPVVSSPAVAATAISLNIVPPVQVGQRITLLLNEATLPPPAAPAAYTFPLPAVTAPTGSLNFPIGTIQSDTRYFVRVAVDGAESLLDLNPASPTFGPTVTTP